MRVIDGDLLDRSHGFEAIGHGVNLRGVMGAGIAKQIADKWPKIVPPYQAACFPRIQGSDKLTLGGIQTFHTGENLCIYNMATQILPGPNAQLDAIWSSLNLALLDCHKWGIKELAIPMIGAGIGGLSAYEVNHIFHHVSEASRQWVELVVVKYKPKGNDS